MHIYLFVLPVFRYIFWWSTRLFIRVPHLHIFLFTTYCIIHGKKLHIETLVDELLKDARYCMILLPVWIAWCSFNFSWPEKVSFCVTSVKIFFFFGWMFPLVQCCALNWVLACMTVNGRMRRDKELIRSEGTESNKPKGDFTSKLFWRLCPFHARAIMLTFCVSWGGGFTTLLTVSPLIFLATCAKFHQFKLLVFVLKST